MQKAHFLDKGTTSSSVLVPLFYTASLGLFSATGI